MGESDAPQPQRRRERSIRGTEKRLLLLLGLPTFGLALSITAVTTYAPLVAKQFTSSTGVIGLLIGAEGLVALGVPVGAGAWSDQLKTKFGGRLPFLLAGVPLVAISMATVGFIGSLAGLAVALFVFFVAYYVAYEPYRALYPDLLSPDIAARGQSTQAVFRGLATGTALIGGGLLFGLSPKLPFVLFALLALAATAGFVWLIRPALAGHTREGHEARNARESVVEITRLVRQRPALRAFLFANALWELALAALKTFVVLFLRVGMGFGMSASVGVIAVVVVLILIAAPVSGKLGDRFGKARVVTISAWWFGLGLLVPFFTQSPIVAAAIVPGVAFGGGMILTLPYAILMPLMPEGEHGLITGFYSFSRGLGILSGPCWRGWRSPR